MYASECTRPGTRTKTGLLANTLALPAQRPPISRELRASQGHENLFGAEAAARRCGGLTGLARQMCYDIA